MQSPDKSSAQLCRGALPRGSAEALAPPEAAADGFSGPSSWPPDSGGPDAWDQGLLEDGRGGREGQVV